MRIIYLKPRSSLKGVELRSDTLFGALCWGIRQIHGNNTLESLLSQFFSRKPPFLISSAFPYKEENNTTIHYLPKPITEPIFPKMKTIEGYEKSKKVKKVKYISEKAFNGVINAKDDVLEDESAFLDTTELIDIDVQRNRINRLSLSTEGALFYSHEIFFPSNMGLYFLLISQKDTKDYIDSALLYLEERGFGGGISVGKGHFKYLRSSDIEIIHQPQIANSFTTLSLYYPTKEEFTLFHENKEMIWYNLIKRKGKLECSFVGSDDIWKSTVQMFSEGSTFPLISGHEVYGENPIVKDKPVFVQHYGFAFPIKMKIGE